VKYYNWPRLNRKCAPGRIGRWWSCYWTSVQSFLTKIAMANERSTTSLCGSGISYDQLGLGGGMNKAYSFWCFCGQDMVIWVLTKSIKDMGRFPKTWEDSPNKSWLGSSSIWWRAIQSCTTYNSIIVRQDPEVCPDSQRASGQTMMMMVMMMMMILISSWNPNMIVWLLVPWGRGILISSWNPIRNPHDCMVTSIWYGYDM